MSTPRRSPRLEAKTTMPEGEIVTPTRSKLRRLLQNTSNASINVCDLSELEKSIHEVFPRLRVELVTYAAGGNKLTRCLLVERSVKEFDISIGPYDEIRLFVDEDRSCKLYVYEKVINEDSWLPSVCPQQQKILHEIDDST